eukprot:GHUV01053622.1.p1 GENE.GHUV01053622.1~~GHUV01053622.1.p1  ORF type:complete len:101 (+),score=11.86 GHUV01053622.1:244-546(+)
MQAQHLKLGGLGKAVSALSCTAHNVVVCKVPKLHVNYQATRCFRRDQPRISLHATSRGEAPNHAVATGKPAQNRFCKQDQQQNTGRRQRQHKHKRTRQQS